MATKEDGWFTKQCRMTDYSLPRNSNKFTNFNLNQSQKFSDYVSHSVQSFSKSNNNKSFEYTVTDSYLQKRKAWNKSTKDSNFSKTISKNLFDEVDEEKSQKSWGNDSKNSNKNGSTLSLHIAAYENFIEAVSDESEEFSKKSKIFKSVVPSFQGSNSFEFPRQMNDNNSGAPEVQQFKASQKLSSPNQGAAAASSSRAQPSQASSKKSKLSLKSLKDFKSSKSTKSAKTTQQTTEGGAEYQQQQQQGIAERRVVLYEGSAFATKPGIKLKKNALYMLLGVQPTATQNEIKKAYRQKALQLHPDKNVHVKNKEELNEKLGQISRAYKILSDPTKRKIYDQYGIDAVQTFEETEISPSWLWFAYTRLGRITSCFILFLTCFFCCFCCCACFCNCFCGCCCNHCCRGDNDEEDGFMEYDPEAARPQRPPPPSPSPPQQPQSKIASIINTLSSKRVLKKKKKTPSAEAAAEAGIPVSENNGQPTSIRVDPRSTPSKVQSHQSNKLQTRSTQDETNREKNFTDD